MKGTWARYWLNIKIDRCGAIRNYSPHKCRRAASQDKTGQITVCRYYRRCLFLLSRGISNKSITKHRRPYRGSSYSAIGRIAHEIFLRYTNGNLDQLWTQTRVPRIFPWNDKKLLVFGVIILSTKANILIF